MSRRLSCWPKRLRNMAVTKTKCLILIFWGWSLEVVGRPYVEGRDFLEGSIFAAPPLLVADGIPQLGYRQTQL